MVQIISPTRLMPGGLNFIRSNPAIDGYQNQGDYLARQDQNDRAEKNQGYTDRDRQRQQDEEDAIGGALDDLLPPYADVNAQPDNTGTVIIGEPEAYDGAAVPTPSPITVSDVPPQRERRQGLAAVTASAAPPTPSMPTSAPAPAPAPRSDVPPPLSSGTGRTGLNAVRAQRPAGEIDNRMARALAKVSPSKALSHLKSADAAVKVSAEEDLRRTIEILDAADTGDINKAMTLAKHYGEDIDPQVLSNGEARRAMRTTAEVAKQMGAGHDQAWMEKFADSFTRTQDINTAIKAAGKPTAAPAAKGMYSMNSKGDVLNTGTGAVQRGAGTAGGAAGTELREVRLFNWLVKERGIPEKLAQDMIFQVKTNPGAMVNTIASMERALINQGVDPIEARKEAQKSYTEAKKFLQKQDGPAADETPSDDDKADAQWGKTPSGDRIYTLDDGDTWYNEDDDTRYDEGE